MKKKVPMQKSIGKSDMKHNKGSTKSPLHSKLGKAVGKPRMRGGKAK